MLIQFPKLGQGSRQALPILNYTRPCGRSLMAERQALPIWKCGFDSRRPLQNQIRTVPVAGVDRDTVRLALEDQDIEARPVWKPMHLQPFYKAAEIVGGLVSAGCFDIGLCLPSGSNLTNADRERVADIARSAFRA